jgi:hypothetical protein
LPSARSTLNIIPASILLAPPPFLQMVALQAV